MLVGRAISDEFIDKLGLDWLSCTTLGTNYEIAKSSSSRFSSFEKR